MSTSINSISIHRHKAHYLPLDSVRGLAASCVVVHHFVISAAFVAIFPNKAWIDVAFFHNAWLFVDLFFVLSGIVISLNYTRSDFGAFSFRDFVVRRLARIYPLHVVTLAAALMFRLLKLGVVAFGLLQVMPAEMQVNNVYSFFVNVFLLHALGFVDYLSWNAPSWSISAEFYTYLIFGVVLVFAQWRRNVRIVYVLSALLMLASALIMVFVMRRTSIDFHYAFGIVRCVFSFFLGVLTVRIVASLPEQVSPAIQTIVQFGSVAAAIVVMSLVAMMPQISFVAPFIFAALLGSLMAFPNRVLPNILSIRPLVWLGKRSYSIYMVHSLVLMLFEYFVRAVGTKKLQGIDGLAPGLAGTGLLLVFLAAVFVVSNLTYLHVEIPGSKAVLRFFNRAPAEKLASAHGGAISQ
ncbi:acyltransferase [Bradyrhizobium prioriisuperbiae]|uniref:acyltransferase family protein n=1 Tax=Bradyrhizobium prioriisuperbiae TaxID=2854389 RepID=UPI0028EF66F0|nr:acyltransferase [Bradyrhizobium prioritasuperba]